MDGSLNARTSDPSTSHAAAAAINDAVYDNVAALMREHGALTDEQLEAFYINKFGLDAAHRDSPRKRRSDLKRDGKVADSGTRQRSSSNRSVIVWNWIG